MLACFQEHIRTPINDFPNVEIQDARRRMPRGVEEELEEKVRESQSQLGSRVRALDLTPLTVFIRCASMRFGVDLKNITP